MPGTDFPGNWYLTTGRNLQLLNLSSACGLMASYNPATNGEAERFVQTFKKSLRAGKDDSGTVPQKLARFLLTFRATVACHDWRGPSRTFPQAPGPHPAGPAQAVRGRPCA